MQKQINLTVAVPTYKRPLVLRETISLLLESLKKSEFIPKSILIIDNDPEHCVDDETVRVLYHVRGLGVEVKYKNNLENIGGGANILRLFEESESTWVWTLGDDDIPQNECFDFIGRCLLGADESLGAVKFSSDLSGSNRFNLDLKKTSDFFGDKYFDIDFLSNLMFLSTWVFRVAIIKKVLPDLYLSINSFAPQLIAAILIVQKRFVVHHSQYQLVTSRPGQWVGTVVHNYLYEYLRVSRLDLETRDLYKIRNILFFERGVRLSLGRVYRAEKIFGSALAWRILSGGGTMSKPAFYFSKILLAIIKSASSKSGVITARLIKAQEKGDFERL